MEHGKWESNKNGGGVFITMSDGSPVFVAEALGKTKEVRIKRAGFIVQACNRDAAFEDLLTACEALVAFCESKERLNGDDVCPTKAYDLAKTALKKKRGE